MPSSSICACCLHGGFPVADVVTGSSGGEEEYYPYNKTTAAFVLQPATLLYKKKLHNHHSAGESSFSHHRSHMAFVRGDELTNNMVAEHNKARCIDENFLVKILRHDAWNRAFAKQSTTGRDCRWELPLGLMARTYDRFDRLDGCHKHGPRSISARSFLFG